MELVGLVWLTGVLLYSRRWPGTNRPTYRFPSSAIRIRIIAFTFQVLVCFSFTLRTRPSSWHSVPSDPLAGLVTASRTAGLGSSPNDDWLSPATQVHVPTYTRALVSFWLLCLCAMALQLFWPVAVFHHPSPAEAQHQSLVWGSPIQVLVEPNVA